MSRVYQVTHTTRYSYEREVTESYGRAHLAPRDVIGQTCLSHRLSVAPAPQRVHEEQDFYGNRSAYVEVLTPHAELAVTASSRVRVDRAVVELDRVSTPWEQAGPDALATLDDPEDALRAKDFLLPSIHVPVGGRVPAFAGEIFTPGRGAGEAVRELIHRVYTDFAYRPGVTSVSTTLDEVLARREGVCQDFAHLAVACLRGAGLPARYVSGYLETLPPPGQATLLGADASHAWVSVLLPGLGWVDLDPTNDRVVDDTYIVTAWGRDYADVPPLKGVIFTEGKVSRLTVAVDVLPLPAHTT